MIWESFKEFYEAPGTKGGRHAVAALASKSQQQEIPGPEAAVLRARQMKTKP